MQSGKVFLCMVNGNLKLVSSRSSIAAAFEKVKDKFKG